MNKSALYEYFNQKIAKSAIQNIDDDWLVVGKYCRVGLDEDGQIDVWICNHKDIPAGLGTRKVKNILSSLNLTVKTPFMELNGEAWMKTRNKDLILRNLKLLGIRAKRQLSPEALEILRERMKTMRSEE